MGLHFTPVKECVSRYIRFPIVYVRTNESRIYKYIINAYNKKPTAYREESSHQIKRPT